MSWFSRTIHGSEPPNSVPVPSEAPRRRAVSPERLTTLNLGKFLREHPRVVIDVWAPWCGPCRAFAPVFSEAANEWGERVGFGKLHADHERSLVARFGVRSIPSLLFFRDGALVRTEVGALSRERLNRQLHRVFRDLP
ncbi:MAG TPA: thioredoxin domain-containing protein [Thermoplasmata archaeon]|nr:thioredoxin domain-containing protein [Thermoplasmata archaeon]